MQWNEGFHTIPRRPEYHKVIALFITSSPELSMLICAIQICTSSTALRMATSPMMIPVCQQHYNTLGARLPTLSTFLTGRLSPPRRNLRWLLVSALFSHGRVNDPRLTPKQRPWLNLLEDSSMKIQTWWLPGWCSFQWEWWLLSVIEFDLYLITCGALVANYIVFKG